MVRQSNSERCFIMSLHKTSRETIVNQNHYAISYLILHFVIISTTNLRDRFIMTVKPLHPLLVLNILSSWHLIAMSMALVNLLMVVDLYFNVGLRTVTWSFVERMFGSFESWHVKMKDGPERIYKAAHVSISIWLCVIIRVYWWTIRRHQEYLLVDMQKKRL